MIINITLEVESRNALRTILQVGSEYSLYDYKVIEYKVTDSTEGMPLSKPKTKKEE